MVREPFLLVLFVGFNALNVVTTAIGFRLGLPESNPLMALLRPSGFLAMVLAKGAVVATVSLVIVCLQRRYRFTWIFWLAACLPVILAASGNVLEIRP